MSPRLFWLLSILAPLPLAGLYAYVLLQQHEFTIPLLALISVSVLTAFRWNRLWQYPLSWTSAGLYILALLLLATAITIWSPWLGAFSTLTFAASFLASHDELFQSQVRNRLSHRTLLYLSVPLIVILRLPLGWENTFYTTYLQYTASISSYGLDALNVPHNLDLYTLELPQHKIVVEQVCGSYQTLLALTLSSLLLSAWWSRPLLVAPFYLLAGLILSGVLQTFRLTFLGVAIDKFDFNGTAGISLLTFQWLSFFGILFLLVSCDALIMFFFAPVSSDTIRMSDNGLRNPLKTLWNRLLRRSKSRRRSNSTRKSTIPTFVLIPLYFVLALGFGLQLAFTLI
jgi:hypothetical protein